MTQYKRTLSKKSKVMNLSPGLVTNLGWTSELIWSTGISPVKYGPELDKLSDPYQLQLFRVLILTSYFARTTWVYSPSVNWLLPAFLQSWGAISRFLNADLQEDMRPPFLPP